MASNSWGYDFMSRTISSADVTTALGFAPLASSAANPLAPISRLATFDVASANLPTYKDYVFGTTATAGAGQVAIRNLSNLAASFNPLEDFTAGYTITSEMQRYQAIGAATHAFASDRLNLTCSIDTSLGYAGGYATQIRHSDTTGAVPDGTTANAIAHLGWANTTGVVVGQLVALQWGGIYRVSALVANTSVTLTPMVGSGTGAVANALNAVLPFFTTTTTLDAANGATQITVAAVPTGVVPGMALGMSSGNDNYARIADHRITNITGNVITVSPALPYGTLTSGTRFVFGPPIVSGQIWSKDQFDLTNPSTVWGFDLYASFPVGAAGGYNTHLLDTSAAIAAVPSDFPWGCWPAFWLYSADGTAATQRDISEIDIIETWYNTNTGPWGWLGADHSPLGTIVNNFRLTSNGWTDLAYGHSMAPASIQGLVRISCIVTPNRTYKYVNGTLIGENQFTWTSQCPAQVGINLAVGTLNTEFAGTLLFPFATANFASMKLGIQRLRILKSS